MGRGNIFELGCRQFPALIALALLTAACGDKATAPVTAPAPSADITAPAAIEAPVTAEAAAQLLQPTDATWTAEALEDLMAPIALYPDIVLGQVLVASTNPQEVLDAGNWLLQNQKLKEKPLDQAAQKAGFTAPVRGLLQSPEVIDLLCSQLDWTTELGQAFVNDQAGVLAAVQRLRAQAKSVGNLKSSPQLKVATETQGKQEVIVISPPSPTIVYVPQYDPIAVYAPPPPAPPAATGHSTSTLVATGLMAFTAGILVHNIFDHNDYYSHGYYPHYYGPPRPYYPPYPYRPSYGGGFYPSHGYTRPPNYQHGFNNNTVIVNNNNNYFNRYTPPAGGNRVPRSVNSPITAVNPQRQDLSALNTQARQAPNRPVVPAASKAGVQGTYAGATREAAARAGAASTATPRPKVQGTYAGASAKVAAGTLPSAAARPAAAAKVAMPNAPAGGTRANERGKPAAAAATTLAAPSVPVARGDRGQLGNLPATTAPAAVARAGQTRPAMAGSGTRRDGALAGVDRAGADRAASARGHQSLPNGVPGGGRAAGGRERK